ncbi:MAG TPA: hypothetical protein PLV50_09305 [Smithella sp.]|nr:hypothetical protein [Smithella sp.]HNY50794.1 hypothetical protein [Smithella sp.]HOG90724.1 hypothetical protein [Smithella sp.]HQG65855.1 hypothetical protein [Smithella sp.]HQH16249.1 hypothetical protein [Smithella sp.]
MLFVGRQIEKKKIMEALSCGGNIILDGKFGMGRIRLIREIARLADERKFVFVDFSQTLGEMSEKIMKTMGISRRIKNQTKQMGYKSMRYRIANANTSKRYKPVIVFDNIAKITAQKKIFLHHLILERYFQFIDVVENFLPQKDLFDLKAQLMPATTLNLRYLKQQDVQNLLRIDAEQHLAAWNDHDIRDLASLSEGYPLGLKSMLEKKTIPAKRREIVQETHY